MMCARLNRSFVTVLLLLVVGLVSADLLETYGCSQDEDYYCKRRDDGVRREPIKCQRCSNTLLEVMRAVKVPRPEERRHRDYCENLITTHEDFQHRYRDTFNAALEQCILPEMLLYDGAKECNSASGGVLASCAATANFHECLCNQRYDSNDFSRLTFCFKTGGQIDLDKACPNGPSGFRDLPPRPTRSLYLMQKDQFAKRVGSHRNGRRDDEYDYECSENGSSFPPCVELQFSPVLRDGDLGFYIDANERCIFVDLATYEPLDYYPYKVPEAAYFDEVFTDEGYYWARRCYWYPFSNNIWCWQFPINEEDYENYADSLASQTLTFSSTIIGTVPATATTSASAAAVTTGSGSQATHTAGSSAAAASSSSGPKGTTQTTSSGPKSAPASAGSQSLVPSWMFGLELLALLYYVLV
ncbi:hypothetical protein VHEMI01329 [[Torrubiella] hemipterigena]|uniref:Uncharacterized protein n=1 Tax=[Torrubiella] hemipterigena TaxID=1531966 RepID=A0A0A1T553_9HYPO|nr:hypothetical protein VHEMI01329 [[Torrubiella] hemipterigena]